MFHLTENTIIEKKIWKFKDSLFADYKKDTDDKFLRAFDFDYSFSKISNFIKDENDLN